MGWIFVQFSQNQETPGDSRTTDTSTWKPRHRKLGMFLPFFLFHRLFHVYRCVKLLVFTGCPANEELMVRAAQNPSVLNRRCGNEHQHGNRLWLEHQVRHEKKQNIWVETGGGGVMTELHYCFLTKKQNFPNNLSGSTFSS